MAETAVCLVIEKLGDLIVEEANLLKGVHKEIESIKDELESIQSFLKDADARAEKQHIPASVKTWVKQVRETAYHIEDVVDEYILFVAQPRLRHRGFVGSFYKALHSFRKLKWRYEVAGKIQDIKTTIIDYKERSDRYKFDSSVQGSSRTRWHDPRLASLFIEEAKIVGIETVRNDLISLLVQEVSERLVISVVGMGGLGKTTVAKKVYDNGMVTGHFDCRAWVAVSHSYKIKELLRIMIKQFCQATKESTPEGIDTMDKVMLIEKLRENLQLKRYVVVFDDVWSLNFWKIIENALPNNNKGSRIIVTTRGADVAASCKESPFDHVHKLQPLPQEKAWELFCKKAFRSEIGGCCPPELETLSLEIVRRCEGLPLAIVVIGDLLSTKGKDVSEWQKLNDSLGSELEYNPHLTSIRRILSLSYHHLPFYLKPCFLYFGIFPEDYSISCIRLIRLWIAEGFVKGQRGKTLEVVAEEYLTELIQRSLVQVSWVDFDGKVRRCRIHDLMREIILSKSEELSFCQVLADKDSSFDGKSTRRLSICNITDNPIESHTNPLLRSFFLFGIDELPKFLMGAFFSNFKLLTVLDLEDAPLDFVPKEVGNLLHLRYLSVRGTKLETLPQSLGKLQNLQTLDLKHSLVRELPIKINLLSSLRHLLANYIDDETDYNFYSRKGLKIQQGIGCLESMQKLHFVETNHGTDLVTELGRLKQLRKLGVQKLTEDQGRTLCASIEKMNHLVSLNVHSISADEILDVQHISSPPPSLQRLYLVGRLVKVPDWIVKLQNVVRIGFYWTGLTTDPVRFLHALPNLLELRLHCAFDGEELNFQEGGFQKLKVMRLLYMNRLNSVIIEKNAMPFLEKLIIGPCPQLKKVPPGIQHLKNLTTLEFYDMPMKFPYHMHPDSGPSYSIVEHIPAVRFGYKREGRGYDVYSLR